MASPDAAEPLPVDQPCPWHSEVVFDLLLEHTDLAPDTVELVDDYLVGGDECVTAIVSSVSSPLLALLANSEACHVVFYDRTLKGSAGPEGHRAPSPAEFEQVLQFQGIYVSSQILTSEWTAARLAPGGRKIHPKASKKWHDAKRDNTERLCRLVGERGGFFVRDDGSSEFPIEHALGLLRESRDFCPLEETSQFRCLSTGRAENLRETLTNVLAVAVKKQSKNRERSS